jgi:carbohydrate-selective porin OprB
LIRRAGLLVASALFSAFAPSAGADEAGAPEADLTTANNFFTRDSLTGDWLRYRTRLEEHGFELGGDEIAEILANPIGGQKQRMTVEGRLELFLNVDPEKAVHWTGASFHANAYQIHGRGLSANAIGNLLTVSNIEAQRSTRLFDLWLQQELFDHAVSIRAGQIAADDEFYVSQYATLFINSTFGWPAILGADLPSGGPGLSLGDAGLAHQGGADAGAELRDRRLQRRSRQSRAGQRAAARCRRHQLSPRQRPLPHRRMEL